MMMLLLLLSSLFLLLLLLLMLSMMMLASLTREGKRESAILQQDRDRDGCADSSPSTHHRPYTLYVPLQDPVPHANLKHKIRTETSLRYTHTR
jgi:hypothetical protein